ncbi:hypothetical protein [Nocardioides sp. REDSEA-S30_B4]|uniref:hypothetical protein n=1 Tax=Nocardioides sp. REDSEA-S30_B4 TaxID=1811552 RepID=UPI000A7A1B15|nr:hypothetical protein [Nocardioides sp. REDSEA-S30_B4]
MQIFGVRLPSGACPALEWLTGLNTKQQAGIAARFRVLAEQGWLRSPDAFNKLDEADPRNGVPRVDEIKHVSLNLRVYVVGFSPGDKELFVTHGTIKPKKNRVAKEVAKARAIYKEGTGA